MELLIVFMLTLVNGALAMAEIAIVSARKVRLQPLADDGDEGAKRALELAAAPNRFLSTVQIGITLVGVLNGAVAGATLSNELATTLNGLIPALQPVSQAIAFSVVVVFTTYISLVVGELVPKRLGMQNPERVARLMAAPMHRLSRLTAPVVRLLSFSTDVLLRVLGGWQTDEPLVTEDDIHGLIAQGVETGVFDEDEREMVAGVFSLDDMRVSALMTPRTEIEWLNLDDPPEANLRRIVDSQHSRFPVARGSLDQVVGILRAKDLLNAALTGVERLNFNTHVKEALYIPESATAAHTLELFKQSQRHIALILSEYGGVEGLITLNNLVEQIVGGIEPPEATQREDGSWLLDGLLMIEDLKALFDLSLLPGEEDGHFQTLGGFVMAQLGHIPAAADSFDWNGLRFEVMDMDGKRVDKVLVSRRDSPPNAPA
jgi:putative hemolysin